MDDGHIFWRPFLEGRPSPLRTTKQQIIKRKTTNEISKNIEIYFRILIIPQYIN